MQVKQQPLQTAFIYGLVLGVALGVSEIALTFLFLLIPYPLAAFVSRLGLFLLGLAYLYAGYHAARSTGQVYAGTLAGALTGAFGVATVIVFLYIATFLHMGLLLNPQIFLGSLPIDIVANSSTSTLSPLVSIALTFAFYGAIVGTIGSLIGKRRSSYQA